MSEPRTPPTLRKQVVATAALGEVIVCGLRLSQRLALNRAGQGGDALAAGDLFCARLLHAACVDAAGRPIYSEDQWDIFGADHSADTGLLVEVAMQLGGFVPAEAKNG